VSKLPEKVSKLPEKVSKLPEKVSKLPEKVSTLPEKVSTLPEKVRKLPEKVKKELLNEKNKKDTVVIIRKPEAILPDNKKLSTEEDSTNQQQK